MVNVSALSAGISTRYPISCRCELRLHAAPRKDDHFEWAPTDQRPFHATEQL